MAPRNGAHNRQQLQNNFSFARRGNWRIYNAGQPLVVRSSVPDTAVELTDPDPDLLDGGVHPSFVFLSKMPVSRRTIPTEIAVQCWKATCSSLPIAYEYCQGDTATCRPIVIQCNIQIHRQKIERPHDTIKHAYHNAALQTAKFIIHDSQL